jgi:hypothetical protein
MQWFKHHNNFRNTPAMRYIASQEGAAGIAAVYRLYEVFTERFGVDNDFSGSITLQPPTTLAWLGTELFLPEESDNPYSSGLEDRSSDDVLKFLGYCEYAGIITIERHEGEVWRLDEKGVSSATGTKQVWTTLTIPGFAALADVYSARKKAGRALETTQ